MPGRVRPAAANLGQDRSGLVEPRNPTEQRPGVAGDRGKQDGLTIYELTMVGSVPTGTVKDSPVLVCTRFTL